MSHPGDVEGLRELPDSGAATVEDIRAVGWRRGAVAQLRPQARRAAFLATVEADKLRGSYIDPNAGKVTLQAFAESWLSTQTTDPATVEALAPGGASTSIRTSALGSYGVARHMDGTGVPPRGRDRVVVVFGRSRMMMKMGAAMVNGSSL